MAKAILPGSYDPVTVGHIDIILRAKDLYGDVTVGILFNPEKNIFSHPRRKNPSLKKLLKTQVFPLLYGTECCMSFVIRKAIPIS